MLIRAIHKSFIDFGKDENDLVLLYIWDRLVKDECLVELENYQQCDEQPRFGGWLT